MRSLSILLCLVICSVLGSLDALAWGDEKPDIRLGAPSTLENKTADRKNGVSPDEETDSPKKNGKSTNYRPPTTLFKWAIAPQKDEDDEEEEEEWVEKRMPNDAPHFTDASAVVGLGRVMLETGYTYTRDRNSGTRNFSHSAPEALLRIGIFAEWFEARVEWNYLTTRTTGLDLTESIRGPEDMAVGFRLALTEQEGCLPESALNFSLSLPTGIQAFTADRLLPELRYHYTWEIIEDVFEFEANTIASSAREDFGHSYMLFAQTANIEYYPIEPAQCFLEWYGLIPHGANGPDILPQHYCHTGLTYFFTNNFALFGHAAVGLNRSADDFYSGCGLIARR